MLPLLEAVLRASPKVKSFEAIDNDPIDAENFLIKLRCDLTSGQTLQIRIRGWRASFVTRIKSLRAGRCVAGIMRPTSLT